MKVQLILIFLFSFICQNSLSGQIYGDSLFRELEFETITQKEYETYESTYVEQTQKGSGIDSNANSKSHDFSITHHCWEICDTYLVEKDTTKKMLLPSNYDAGIIDLAFSPADKYLVLCSSYDGPDYIDYYDYRSEIFLYKITDAEGLDAVQLDFYYYSEEWSIESLVWVGEDAIALKIYTEARWGDGSELNFEYVRARIE